jgi:hypothetical protein
VKTVYKMALAAITILSLTCLSALAEDGTGIISQMAGAGKGTALPVSHMIDVPWHQQMNGLFCGEGVLEGVYDYWGPDIDQKQIANVARSSSAGTWSFDMVRAGHFSNQSAAQGRFFPGDVPMAGYLQRPIGYASFPYSSDQFWIDELKTLLAADIPVILLMTYEPDGGGGHYRTAIGYDDRTSTLYFSDPWGRDQNHQTNWTGITAWAYDEVQSGWNYIAEGEEKPYFAVIMMPWHVDLKISGQTKPESTMTVSADVTYPAPDPIDRSLFPAEDAVAVITLPEGMRLVSGSSTVSLGEMQAGTTKRARWKVMADSPVTGKTITVTAYGTVSGHVPEARWTGEQKFYPPYDYTDIIGGEGSTIF